MARICAFVFNPVVRDARVVKQANSLAAQGHKVTVIGLADNNYPEDRETLETGVEILRVPRTVGTSVKPAGRVERWTTAAYRRHLHLLLLPPVLIYIAVIGFTGSRDEKIDRMLDFLIFGSLLAGVVYLFANLSNLVQASLSLATLVLGKLLGTKRVEHARHRLIEMVRHRAPARFDQEIERRSQARVEHMVQMARALAPDIVHCHDIHTLPAGAAMKKLTGCRAIYDAHEIYEELAQSREEASHRYRDMHRRFLPLMDGFVTINDSIANWYKENYPRIPEPVVVMNATIRTPDFDYDGRLHRAAGLPRDARILLYQGGFARKRGLEYLLESAAFLPANWTLVMMGWGRIEPELRAIAEQANAAAVKRKRPAVRFLPPVPQEELPYWSAGATIGVIPYENVGLNHWFCTPNKLWEYPNAGVPVLVSPFPELRKPVEAYGYGWLLPEEQDPKLLAERVKSLTDGEIARASEACATFSSMENWSKYEIRLIALYDRLLGREAPQADRQEADAATAAPQYTLVAPEKAHGASARKSA